MAKDVEAPEAPAEEWDTISTGLGTEWDFDKSGPLVGRFVGTTTVETTKVESGEATAYLFDVDRQGYFVWGSAEIEKAFARKIPDTDDPIIAIGDRVRIEYLGRENFTGEKGPQQIKRYRVQIPKAGSPRA